MEVQLKLKGGDPHQSRYQRQETHMQRTEWVAPGEGSTLGELVKAFGTAPRRYCSRIEGPARIRAPHHLPEVFGINWRERRTNLTLRRSSGIGTLQNYDFDRFQSEALEVA